MVTNNHYRWDFIGLSTDVKPTPATSEKVVDGSTFYCSDTSKLYVYCKDNWYERKPLGGGGGGSYTAGNGIDITNDTISVDTTVVQEKLTAGSNITIEDNVISATGGGGSVTVVQTAGDSTTDVMSQDATTKLIYSDFVNYPKRIKIGGGSITTGGVAINGSIASANSIAISGDSAGLANVGANGRALSSVVIGTSSAVAQGDYSVAIGYNSYANSGSNTGDNVAIGRNTIVGNFGEHSSSVALGAYAKTTRGGEVNIGAGTNGTGYNNTNYRVLGGVHDGQLAQDAVTVAQVNATIDAINTALSTNIPHIGA